MKGPNYSATELLARLVSFDTTSHKSNLAAHPFRRGLSAPARRRQPDRADAPTARRPAFTRPSVPRACRASRSPDTPTSCRSTGSGGPPNPFIVTERDGKLYGRGTADMKGFLACVLAAVPGLAERQLAVPIHLAFSYDEEIGCLGVRPMIAEFGRRLVKPRMVLVGEPTSMTVVD